MSKEQLLETVGSFTWSFHDKFLVEIPNVGNFVWSDPDYRGDNSFKRYDGNYKQWCKEEGIPFGRDKGKHKIRNYCGSEIKIVGL
jgi:hypothetical protein